MLKKDELEYLEFSNALSTIKLTLQGAHIFDFKIKGKPPLLFLSESAHFKKGKAIRGGVPICWPWFGAHPHDSSLPNHGFVRTALWKHLETRHLNEACTQIILGLESSEESLKLWPYDFELKLEITISDTLELSLITTNKSNKPFTLTQALHTYLQITDIHAVQVEGLQNKPFYNKLDDTYGNVEKETLHFNSEVDRVYQGLDKPLILVDKQKKIEVKTVGSQSVVVWNPGENFADSFSDLSDYKSMLCLESANALDDAITLKPNETHTLTSILSPF